MKKEFKMQDGELVEMVNIAQSKPSPVLVVGDVITGGEKQSLANQFWQRLADKYGFLWDTVEPCPDKGYNYFMATLKPQDKPEMSLKEIVKQLEFCEYEDKHYGHPLKNNVAFCDLKKKAERE